MSPRPPRLTPAKLEFTELGVPFCAEFDDVYHASHGGLEQTRHVFLQGNQLLGATPRWQGRDSFTILETGFGCGLNFLATWQAWQADPQRSQRLHFVSVERQPFSAIDLAHIHQTWPELADFAAQLRAVWPPLTPGCHRLLLADGKVTLTLYFGDALKLLPKALLRADAVFLDGFSPAKNPDMWQPGLLKTISRLCAAGTTLSSWTVAGSVREALKHNGWHVSKAPGFLYKRHMLQARFQPLFLPRFQPRFQPRLRGDALRSTPATEKHAIVIGAGVAGSSTAERLAARGWQVEVLEKGLAPAMQASGNPAGLMHPVITRDDNITARITRACHLFALQMLATLDKADLGLVWGKSGILQLARDDEQSALQAQAIADLGFPTDYCAYVDREQASAMAGMPVLNGGWYFPEGGWISPPSLCAALLRRWPQQVSVRQNCTVEQLQKTASGWDALDAAGKVIASAPSVILANAADAARLIPDTFSLNPIRGQVSIINSNSLPALAPLNIALCGHGYVTPQAQIGERKLHCFGATYDMDDPDAAVREVDHQTNLGHLNALLPALNAQPALTELQGRVGFRAATIDRLPLVGAVPDSHAALPKEPMLGQVPRLPGLFALVGLGSRGMVWAPLAAEMLAATLSGEPLPLERDLVEALDPARFIVRQKRRELQK